LSRGDVAQLVLQFFGLAHVEHVDFSEMLGDPLGVDLE
jgi:hypothetical protein